MDNPMKLPKNPFKRHKTGGNKTKSRGTWTIQAMQSFRRRSRHDWYRLEIYNGKNLLRIWTLNYVFHA